MNVSKINHVFSASKNILKPSNGCFLRSMCNNALSKSRPWRNAATLLIVAPMKQSLGFLVMTRSKRSKFMPGSVVFPGGVVSSADSSQRWLDLYKTTGLELKNPGFFSLGARLPFIYTDVEDESISRDAISIEVSLRITAIREMFEECGILLCKPFDKAKITGDDYQFKELSDPKIVSEWQEKSRENAEQFLHLCEKISCVPDLNALGDWSNWLTPTTYQPRSRFNTIFYMTVLSKPLPVIIDPFEVQSARWETAATLLKEDEGKQIVLMPPQHYELSRLEDIQTQSDMKRLLEKRKELGLDVTFPVIVAVKDGVIRLLKGDDLYPENPDMFNVSKQVMWPKAIEEYRNSAKNLHRAEIADDGDGSISIIFQ